MITLPDPNDALLENLRAEFSGKKTIGRLLHTVIPHLEEDKRSLGYMSDGGDIEEQGVLLHEKNAEELADLAKIMFERDRSGTMTYPDNDRLALFCSSLRWKYEQTVLADPAFCQKNMDFYAYAHDFGWPAPSVLYRNGYPGAD